MHKCVAYYQAKTCILWNLECNYLIFQLQGELFRVTLSSSHFVHPLQWHQRATPQTLRSKSNRGVNELFAQLLQPSIPVLAARRYMKAMWLGLNAMSRATLGLLSDGTR